jgi:hypothetical protein
VNRQKLNRSLRFVVSAAQPFTGRDIPGGLDEAGRLVLGRTLQREGALTLG